MKDHETGQSGQDARSLVELLREYDELLLNKAALDRQAEEAKEAVRAKKEEVMEAMRQADIPAITTGGVRYSLTIKTAYSKKSDKVLQAAGLDYFTVLRQEGLGDIIVERVDPRTLQSTMVNYVAEHGDLSPGLAAVLTSYEYTDMSRTKEKKPKQRGGAKAHG